MADDLTEAIKTAAAGPAKATGDGISVEQHKLTDLIAASNHLAAQAAVKKKGRGFIFNKLEPPGTV